LVLSNETLKFHPFPSAFRSGSSGSIGLFMGGVVHCLLDEICKEEKLEGKFHSAKIVKVNQTTFTFIFLSITCFWRNSNSISTNHGKRYLSCQ